MASHDYNVHSRLLPPFTFDRTTYVGDFSVKKLKNSFSIDASILRNLNLRVNNNVWRNVCIPIHHFSTAMNDDDITSRQLLDAFSVVSCL